MFPNSVPNPYHTIPPGQASLGGGGGGGGGYRNNAPQMMPLPGMSPFDLEHANAAFFQAQMRAEFAMMAEHGRFASGGREYFSLSSMPGLLTRRWSSFLVRPFCENSEP
jgi:hypothetical protein